MPEVKYGYKVRSLRHRTIEGWVVGFGGLKWPDRLELPGDKDVEPVLLVQVEPGSSALGPACVVLRQDMVEVLQC